MNSAIWRRRFSLCIVYSPSLWWCSNTYLLLRGGDLTQQHQRSPDGGFWCDETSKLPLWSILSKITIKLWTLFINAAMSVVSELGTDRHCKSHYWCLKTSGHLRNMMSFFFNLWFSSLHKCILNSHTNCNCHGLGRYAGNLMISQASLFPTAIDGDWRGTLLKRFSRVLFTR